MDKARSSNFRAPPNSAKGKHTKAPGYKPGDHWVVCDRSGAHILASEARKTWDGLLVAPSDWEPRHEQDFVRGRSDNTSVEDPRPQPKDKFIEVTYTADAEALPTSTFGDLE